MYVALSGGILLISVMSQQYNCLMELYKKITFHENVFSLFECACIYELDQKDYWYPRKTKKLWKSMYKFNGE